MGSSGGGGTPSTTTSIQRTELPAYVQPYAEAAMTRGVDLSNLPYSSYGALRIAPLTPQHQAGLSAIENRALYGSPVTQSAQGFLTGTLQGQNSPWNQQNPYMGAQTPGAQNPYIGSSGGTAYNPYIGSQAGQISNPYLGASSGGAYNPYIGQGTQVGANPYAGANPYFEQQLQNTLRDVSGRVNAQFGNSNAFGGSANQELLQRGLLGASMDARGREYERQMGLAESDIARRAQYGAGDIERNAQLAQQMGQFNVGVGQQDIARNAQIAQQLAATNLGATQADLERNAQLAQQQGQFNIGATQADLARNAQLAQQQGQFNVGVQQGDVTRNAALAESGLNRGMEAYNADMRNRLQAAALAPQLAQQDYADYQNLLSVGDISRQTAQDTLNLQYEDWLRAQQYPYQQLDVLSNAIRGGMGGGGTTTTTAPNPYQPNRAAGMLGGGLLGAGIAQMAGFNPGYGAAGGALLPWIFG